MVNDATDEDVFGIREGGLGISCGGVRDGTTLGRPIHGRDGRARSRAHRDHRPPLRAIRPERLDSNRKKASHAVAILADRMPRPRKWGVMIPGPQNHLGKLAFERYYLWKVRQGYVQLL